MSLWNFPTTSNHDVLGQTIMQAIQHRVDFKQLNICQEAELLPEKGEFEVWFSHTKEIPQK